LIGYPPIHQHHFHFFGSGNPIQAEINNHPESQCLQVEGGVNCLVRTAPFGMAYYLRDRYGFMAETNDVRPNHSQPLQSWLFLAAKHVATHQISGHPFQIRLHNLEIPIHNAPRNAYWIKTGIESVSWNAGIFLLPLRNVIDSYLHSHMDVVEDVWVFQGNASSVFASMEDARQSFRVISEGRRKIDETKLNIAKRQLDAHAAWLACSYRLSSPGEWVKMDGKLQRYYRKARCSLDPEEVEWVLLVFHKRQQDDLGELYSLHVELRVIYSAEGNVVLTDDTGIPSEGIGSFLNHRFKASSMPDNLFNMTVLPLAGRDQTNDGGSIVEL